MPPSPVRLNHAVVYVTDLERSVRFCGDLLDMEVIDREPRANAAFLRLPRSGNHHWGDFEFAATVEPLDLPGEVSRWSGVATAG